MNLLNTGNILFFDDLWQKVQESDTSGDATWNFSLGNKYLLCKFLSVF